MYANPILAQRMAELYLEERRAEAAHNALLAQARAARPVNRPGQATRRALGLALVRLGTSLGGAPLERPASQPA